LSGDGSGDLAEEQAALRRVATLVARGAAPEEVFTAVVAEVGQLLPVDSARMGHYESDGTLAFVAGWGRADFAPVGSRWSTGGKNVSTLVFQTGRPARIDSYAEASGPLGAAAREKDIRSSVATPVIVEGRLWGVMIAGASGEQRLPAETEARLTSFTELLATAIANAESRAALARLADEQSALRRVATLVARGAAPEEVFTAVVAEVGQLVAVDLVNLCRFETDRTETFVATWGKAGKRFPAGGRWPLGGENIAAIVSETGRPARIDSYADASGPLGAAVRETGLRSAIGTPVIVEGRLWGMIAVGSSQQQPPPADTEERLTSFTKLVATAVANAESRAALLASRARIVAAADEARRRIERDLRDGIQQQLASLMLELRAVQAAVPAKMAELDDELARIAGGLAGLSDRVREISHGIHPAVLSEQGLPTALRELGRRAPLPVELVLHAGRLPGAIEVAAYYAVSEAVANAAKHARASAVHVELDTPGGPGAMVRLAIRDDGTGGADPARGSGLTGLRDRIEALGGRLDVASPVGGGTALLIELPAETKNHPEP
jgi:signal transduction histidine kinase